MYEKYAVVAYILQNKQNHVVDLRQTRKSSEI